MVPIYREVHIWVSNLIVQGKTLCEPEVYLTVPKHFTLVEKLTNICRILLPHVFILVDCHKKGHVKDLSKPKIEGATNYRITLIFFNLLANILDYLPPSILILDKFCT